jgi:3-oxoacyl-[acyl-carrier-protein] synthase III
MQTVKVTGTGSFLPGPPIENQELVERFGRKLVWLCKMFGAKRRHAIYDFTRGERREGLSNHEMGHRAARAALEDAGREPGEIDLIVMATGTPDYVFPGPAYLIQDRLGLGDTQVIELRAGCGGMAQAFVIATSLITGGTATRALLVGSEFLSAYHSLIVQEGKVGNQALASIAMFGDGAGAVVLEPAGDGEGGLLHADFTVKGAGRRPGITLERGGALDVADGAGARTFTHDYRSILKHGGDVLSNWGRWVEGRGIDPSRVDRRRGGQLLPRLRQHRLRRHLHRPRPPEPHRPAPPRPAHPHAPHRSHQVDLRHPRARVDEGRRLGGRAAGPSWIRTADPVKKKK